MTSEMSARSGVSSVADMASNTPGLHPRPCPAGAGDHSPYRTAGESAARDLRCNRRLFRGPGPTYLQWVGTARKLSREDKRRRIIDAAVQVFAEKGFFGARVSEIADAAGVADGTIYLYFKSKDDLLVSLFEEKMQGIIENLVAALSEHTKDPEAKIRRYIAEHLRLVADQPALMQVLTIELRQSARFIKEYHPKEFRRYLELLQGILEEGQRQGVFREDLDPLVFRRALFGALDEMSLEWILKNMEGARNDARPKRDPNQVAEVFSDFMIRGLRS